MFGRAAVKRFVRSLQMLSRGQRSEAGLQLSLSQYNCFPILGMKCRHVLSRETKQKYKSKEYLRIFTHWLAA